MAKAKSRKTTSRKITATKEVEPTMLGALRWRKIVQIKPSGMTTFRLGPLRIELGSTSNGQWSAYAFLRKEEGYWSELMDSPQEAVREAVGNLCLRLDDLELSYKATIVDAKNDIRYAQKVIDRCSRGLDRVMEYKALIKKAK